MVLAISLDGRIAPPMGGAANIGGVGDKKVLEKALAWADAALIGGGTIRAHRKTCLINNPTLIQQRILEGKSKQPTMILVSNRKEFEKDWPFFNQEIERWLISSQTNCIKSYIPKYFSKHISQKTKWSKTLLTLSKLGLSKLLILGGADLAQSLLSEDEIDELQLTISPKILGGKYTWVPSNSCKMPLEFTQDKYWELRKVTRLPESEIVIHYTRQRIEINNH